jgi:protein involved in polysaccharide export with SLBB domain
MRIRLACGLRLPINVSPQPLLTRYARSIRVQLLRRSRNRTLRSAAALLAMLPAIGFSQFTTQMTGQINSQSATTSSAPETTAPPASSSGSANSSSTALPTAITAPPGYQLSANDGIGVEVFGEEDLKTTARLNSEGNASLPLLGSVHLAGLTLTQATTRVTELYARDYLVSPKVNVTLLGYARRRFTVLGQVNKPGSYEMPETSPGGIDLMEAIAMAGGYTRIAAPERTSVRRHLANGADQMMRVNAKRVERGQTANCRIQDGDSITVGESIF